MGPITVSAGLPGKSKPIRRTVGTALNRTIAGVFSVTGRRSKQPPIEPSSHRLRRWSDLGPLVIYAREPANDFRVTSVTENIRTHFGYEPEEFIDNSAFWDAAVHPKDRDLVCAELGALRKVRCHVHEYRFRHKNGGYRWLRDEMSLQRDPSGNPSRIVGNWLDITDRKQAEADLRRSEKRFRDFAEAASDWFWETDAALRYTWFSDRAPAGPGDPGRQAIGGTLFDMRMSIDDDNNWAALRADLDARKPFSNFEFPFHADDGMTRYVRTSGRPVYSDDGQFLGYRGTANDITQRKHAEQALTTLNQELERRVEIRTHQITEAKEAADAANRAKSKFLSHMSHELRTPLNAIIGFGQVLEGNEKEPLSPMQGKAVKQILQGGQHLLQLIDEILDLATVEAGKITISLEELDPVGVIESCLALTQAHADEHGVQLINRASGSDLPKVLADATRFKQALLNLLSNAVKYNRNGGTVTVDAEEGDDCALLVSVADTGPGIPADRQSELFEPFARLDAKGSQIEGTGIGLTITKQLVELMDGRIGLESAVGRGSIFWIELPLAGASSPKCVRCQYRGRQDLCTTFSNSALCPDKAWSG